MNTHVDDRNRTDGGSKTIITLELPDEAARKMETPGFLAAMNEQFAKAGLPRVEAISSFEPIESTDTAR